MISLAVVHGGYLAMVGRPRRRGLTKGLGRGFGLRGAAPCCFVSRIGTLKRRMGVRTGRSPRTSVNDHESRLGPGAGLLVILPAAGPHAGTVH